MQPLPLLTRRLTLRELTHDDTAALYYTVNEPSVLRAMPGWQIDRITAARMIDSYTGENLSLRAGEEHLLLAVALRHSGEFLGLAGLNATPELPGEPEVQVLLSERHRMCGYSSEALRALAEWVFLQTELPFLTALAEPSNHAGRRTLSAVGFTRVDTLLLPFGSRTARPYEQLRLLRGEILPARRAGQ
jgi:ribosomal-protein-alanine N-acetyltransferase